MCPLGWPLLKVSYFDQVNKVHRWYYKTVLLEYSNKVNVLLEHTHFLCPKKDSLLNGDCRQGGGINLIPPDVVGYFQVSSSLLDFFSIFES